MTIDDVCSDFFARYGRQARDFLLDVARAAKELHEGAEHYDPRYMGTVGLALGAAVLHDHPWDSDLGSMVLKLADHTNRYHNSYGFADEVQREFETRCYQLQSRIWEYVSSTGRASPSVEGEAA